MRQIIRKNLCLTLLSYRKLHYKQFCLEIIGLTKAYKLIGYLCNNNLDCEKKFLVTFVPIMKIARASLFRL